VRSTHRVLLASPLAAVIATACIFGTTVTHEVRLLPDTTVVHSPAKAHLLDGSVVRLPKGFVLEGSTITGDGVRYGPTLRDSTLFRSVALDSVAGVEAFDFHVNGAATAVGSLGGLVLGSVAAAGLAVAIFGSCPTFYADSAGTPVLEAEAFSYSIAPLFEARDVDALSFARADGGVLRLEVRNEAAETHYINQLALLKVDHEANEQVLPDQRGIPLAVSALAQPVRARDRAGRDVRAVLMATDGNPFSSDSARLAAATADDPRDYLDLDFAVPDHADSVTVALWARSSLFTTVLLYDAMLAGQGARAIDWIGHDLARIDNALALGRWYVNAMGLHVSVREDGAWREVAWIRDVGPIAWKELGVMVPAHGDSVHVRLSFVTDAWRIDRVALAAHVRRPAAELFPTARILGVDGRPVLDALRAVRRPDDRYLETTPGQRFIVEFDTGIEGASRSFLLVSQGYYVEWMRPDWLRAPPATFEPSNAQLGIALDRWRATRDDFERRFYASRLPVRAP